MARNEPGRFEGATEEPFRPDADRPRQDWTLAIVLAATLILEAMIVIAVLHFAGAAPGQLAAVLGVILLVAPPVMWIVIRLTWAPISRRHPEQPVGPGAASRRFQSFSLGGLARFSNCLTIVVDERHLHLGLPPPLDWCGHGISIPWEALRDPKPRHGGRWIEATLDGRKVGGPAWCLQLIEPADSKDDAVGN